MLLTLLSQHMYMALLFSMITAYPCFGDKGTFVINVKIYVDEESARSIGTYTRDLLDHNSERSVTEDKGDPLLHVKLYFGMIFDEINAQLKNANIQLLADFSEMLAEKNQHMKNKYCVKLSNILNIAETFLSELGVEHDMGENRILVLNCEGNNALLPMPMYAATRNDCGYVLGELLTDPAVLRQNLLDNIYRILQHSSQVHNVQKDELFEENACAFVHKCSREFPEFGYFVKGQRTVGSKRDLVAFEHNKEYLWSFGHASGLRNHAIEAY